VDVGVRRRLEASALGGLKDRDGAEVVVLHHRRPDPVARVDGDDFMFGAATHDRAEGVECHPGDGAGVADF
jgi:hypothetical protein